MRMVVGWEEPSAGDLIQGLRNQLLVECQPLYTSECPDVRLLFSGELAVEVFVASSIEPWVLRLPGGPTLVPSPTDPNWFDEVR
jgi:hypothetical protein